MASICRRRRCSRCCWSSPSRTSWLDLVDELALGEGLLGPAQHELDPLGHLHRLEQLDLPLGVELGPPSDEVGEAARVVGVDAAQDALHLAVAEVLEQGPQRGPQLRAEGLGLLGRRRLVDAVGGHPQAGARADDAGAEPHSSRGSDDERLGAPRQHTGRLHLGEGADRGEAALHLGDQDELSAGVRGRPGRRLGLVGVGGDRHDHAGQDHAVGKGERRQGVGIDGTGHAISRSVTCDLQATTYGRRTAFPPVLGPRVAPTVGQSGS